MSELIGLSLDQSASPYLSFTDDLAAAIDEPNGWGVAWYPEGELGAAVVRDPDPDQAVHVTEVLADRSRVRTPLLMSHIRGAAKRANYRDTHPFVRILAGRSWAMAHNGDLVGDLSAELPIPTGPELVPIGPTDTEHLFMWLLGNIVADGATSIMDFGTDRLADLMRTANGFGTLNMMLTDGSSLFAYRCSSGFQPMFCGRFIPPYGDADSLLRLNESGVSLGLSGHDDWSRTVVVVSTLAFDEKHFDELEPGAHVVAVGGRASVASGDPEQNADIETSALVPSPVVLAPKSQYRRLGVEHTTTYSYAAPITRSSHRFRLEPVHDRFQQVLDHEVSISVDGFRFDFEDVFGNNVIGLDIDTPYTELVVALRAMVDVNAPLDRPSLLPQIPKLPATWMPWQEHMMHSYLLPPELPESQLQQLIDYAYGFATRNRYELLPTLDDIAWTIYSDYSYKPGFTTVETTPYEVFHSRAGVCQDFANLMICLARILNIPARYRVGYIFTGADYDNTLQSDASHAWVETYLPMMGWRGYDPTNGSRVGADHIRVAKGRNYRDATPTSGVIYQGAGSGSETMKIDVRVNDVS